MSIRDLFSLNHIIYKNIINDRLIENKTELILK